MIVRQARETDIPSVAKLLYEVQRIHAAGRPDLFVPGARKYSDTELRAIFSDANRPVLVAESDGEIVGYAFCILKPVPDSATLQPVKSLYIDDLCVEEGRRGEHIGSLLYEAVSELARRAECTRMTLNVWSLNQGAMRFYEKCGMKPLKVTMETIL